MRSPFPSSNFTVVPGNVVRSPADGAETWAVISVPSVKELLLKVTLEPVAELSGVPSRFLLLTEVPIKKSLLALVIVVCAKLLTAITVNTIK